MMPVPKEKRENGYRREKKTPVPKEKRENGYRAEKMMPVPKRNSSLPQKALRVDIFSKERYNSWKKAPMEESSHGRKLPWKKAPMEESSHGRKIPFAEGHRRQLWIYLNI